MVFKVRPVHRYPQPAYPTRLQVLDHPDLLRRHLPAGWRQTELAGLVSLFLAANCTVRSGDKATACRAVGDTGDCRTRAARKRAACLSPHALAIVAPIFDHGEGRGATGCVVVNPPAFLSEEEALQVIGEELRRVRLELDDESSPLPDVRVGWWSKLRVVKVKCTRQIAVVFAGEHNSTALGSASSGLGITVRAYDFKRAALSVAEQVREHGHGLYLGTFYDPATDVAAGTVPLPEWRYMHRTGLRRSKGQLRLQVTDFIQWLKAQGAI